MYRLFGIHLNVTDEDDLEPQDELPACEDVGVPAAVGLPFPPQPPQPQPLPVEHAIQAAVTAAVQGVLASFNNQQHMVMGPSIQPLGAHAPTFARAGQAVAMSGAGQAVAMSGGPPSVKALSRWQSRAGALDEPGWVSKKRQRAIDHAARKAAGEQSAGPSYVDIVMCVQCNLQQPGRRCPFRCCRTCCPLDAEGEHCEQHCQD